MIEGVDIQKLPSPCYVIDQDKLLTNARKLLDIQQKADCKILLALKGFATFSTFSLLRPYLAGVAASSPHEARLGKEEFAKEVHAYAPAYTESDMESIVTHAQHVVLNSVSQLQRHRDLLLRKNMQIGLRVNPQHSEVATPLYDPCAPGSRLGVTADTLDNLSPAQTAALSDVSGLHFHTLCELGSDALARTLAAVETKFPRLLQQVRWVNFGGGHHITRPDYDTDLLVQEIIRCKQTYHVEVYLEPGEAVALHTGYLVATVEDIIDNTGPDKDQPPIAILDTSATAHMPDVLEMPYRPVIEGAAEPQHHAHTYRLGGMTCLAGDVIGDYSFEKPLHVGSRLVFQDMAHYTMVKNTMFNGVGLPSIVLITPGSRDVVIARRFGYQDYRNRLS